MNIIQIKTAASLPEQTPQRRNDIAYSKNAVAGGLDGGFNLPLAFFLWNTPLLHCFKKSGNHFG